MRGRESRQPNVSPASLPKVTSRVRHAASKGCGSAGRQQRVGLDLREGELHIVAECLRLFAPPEGGNLANSIIQKTHKDFSRRCALFLVPSRFSSVVLPIFGSTTDKFRQLYRLRLVSQHQSSSKWLAPCCAPRSLLSGARTCSTNEYNRGEKQGFV
jgi:hypothetical protein